MSECERFADAIAARADGGHLEIDTEVVNAIRVADYKFAKCVRDGLIHGTETNRATAILIELERQGFAVEWNKGGNPMQEVDEIVAHRLKRVIEASRRDRHPEAFVLDAEQYECPFCESREIVTMPELGVHRPTAHCQACDAIGVWGFANIQAWSWASPLWEVAL
jgi:hypothetical protein